MDMKLIQNLVTAQMEIFGALLEQKDTQIGEYVRAAVNEALKDFRATLVSLPLPGKVLYSKKEAAELLSISVKTLDRHIAFKEMPVRRIGRQVLIHRQAIESFARHDHASPPQSGTIAAKEPTEPHRQREVL